MLSIQRDYNLKSVSSFELGDYPRALSDMNGLMEKPDKHVLMNVIENEANFSTCINNVLSSDHCMIHIFDQPPPYT